jgi:cytochrome bd-type quinol oxidase subunit 2
MSSVLDELNAKLDRMDKDMEAARSVGRDAIYRIALLSGAIIGFSATLLSIKTVSARVDIGLLEASWFLFVAVIAIGPLSIYIEARTRYAIAWRATQQQNFDRHDFPLSMRLKFVIVLGYTFLVRPRNLNQKLHVVVDVALAAELVLWPLFVGALLVLVLAVTA